MKTICRPAKIVLAAALFALVLGSCVGPRKPAAPGSDQPAPVTKETVRNEYTTNLGDNVREGQDLDAPKLPQDVSVIPGSKISQIVERPDGGIWMKFDSPVNSDAALEGYAKSLPPLGWKAWREVNKFDSALVLYYKKPFHRLQIEITPVSDKSCAITLTYAVITDE